MLTKYYCIFLILVVFALLCYLFFNFFDKKTNSGNLLKYLKNDTFITKEQSILNFGSGDGLLSKALYDLGYKNIKNCDIQDLSVDKNIPTILYDGKTLPFEDKSFDVVLINFVFLFRQISYVGFELLTFSFLTK